MKKNSLIIINVMLIIFYVLLVLIVFFNSNAKLISKIPLIGAGIAMIVNVVSTNLDKIDRDKKIRDDVEKEHLKYINEFRANDYKNEINKLQEIMKQNLEINDYNREYITYLNLHKDSKKLIELNNKAFKANKNLRIDSVAMIDPSEKNEDVLDEYIGILNDIKLKSLNYSYKDIDEWLTEYVFSNPNFYNRQMRMFNNSGRLVQIMIQIIGRPIINIGNKLNEISNFGTKDLTYSEQQILYDFSKSELLMGETIMNVLNVVVESRIRRIRKLQKIN